MPSMCLNRLAIRFLGKSAARTAARDATSGRRAHQTWSRLGAGNAVIGVRSRRLSIPSAAIGSHPRSTAVSSPEQIPFPASISEGQNRVLACYSLVIVFAHSKTSSCCSLRNVSSSFTS